ncbi:Uncharacterized protein Adt_14228 [Abeliophyllum distichum]|uniref:Uncharacterized protein n=1 Tax=Abeliophyllum distichum TaxID=126358 RepID=A0ABD1TZ20_9LAMI
MISIPKTQPNDRQPIVSQTPRKRYLSGRNNLSSNPIDQENVQSDEEVFVSPEGDTNIDENVTIQDLSSIRQSQRIIRKLSRCLLVGESKLAIFVYQVDDPTLFNKARDKIEIFIGLYVDNILLIENDVEMSSSTKAWLAQQFSYEGFGQN